MTDVNKPGIPVDQRIIDYHKIRFAGNNIQIDKRTPQRTILVVDTQAKLPDTYLSYFDHKQTQIFRINQRWGSVPYVSPSSLANVIDINLWPKGSIIPSNEERSTQIKTYPELLRTSSSMAEDAVAIGQLVGAQLIVGVDHLGGVIASEVSTRLGIGNMLFMSEVASKFSPEISEKKGCDLIDALATLWAETSAVRSAERIVTAGQLSVAALNTIKFYSGNDQLQTANSSHDFFSQVELLMGVSGNGTSVLPLHRTTQVWRSDLPKIADGHKKAAYEILPHMKTWISEAKKRGKRLIVTCGGESGSGKTEIASYLQLLLHLEGIQGTMVPGDAFFKRAPSVNHAHRVALYGKSEEELNKYLMSSEEIDYERLDAVLKDASDVANPYVLIPSDARRIDVKDDLSGYRSRRYEDAPVWLKGIDVVFVDLTTSAKLTTPDVKIMYTHTYKQKLEHIKARNQGRDPDQDFEFIKTVLKLEHGKVTPLLSQAHVLFDLDYNLQIVNAPFSVMTPGMMSPLV